MKQPATRGLGRLLPLFLASLLAPVLLGTWIGLSFASQPGQIFLQQPRGTKLSGDVQEALVELETGEFLEIVVHLSGSNQIELTKLPTDKISRRQAVVDHLQGVAHLGQQGLIERLSQLRNGGSVTTFQSLWIVNAIIVNGQAPAITELAARPDVTQITLNKKVKLIEPSLNDVSEPTELRSWGIDDIRARHVWEALGVDGTDVTIAILDSGVDWTHPALKDNYRGNNQAGSLSHNGHWFDAVDGTSVPIDPLGHGTHVAGTAVGQLGLGVAPGARWIAARAFNESGIGTVGTIHAAYQWLLAPNGDTSLSPDVVNNSWSTLGYITDFIPDVTALRQAGIVQVFSAGNLGPNDGSIGAPASYPDTISVGAYDDTGDIAWFSSRGPSELSYQTKPTIAAPGARVLSSIPGGAYSYLNGTSMAAPHVSGVLGLLLSVNPTLSQEQLTTIITSTAASTGLSLPNNDSGWGRLDAYAAVTSEMSVALLTGRIESEGTSLAGIPISLTTQSGRQLVYYSDFEGLFQAPLVSGTYRLNVDAFGNLPYASPPLIIHSSETLVHEIMLQPLPQGALSGRLTKATTFEPVSGTLKLLGTPVEIKTDEDGWYSRSLPVGRYGVLVDTNGYRVASAEVDILQQQTATLDFQLSEAPKILLVDSGQWYYGSEINYFKDALTDNDYASDLWSIRTPFRGAPGAEVLSKYDIVFWSSPLDSTNYVGAGADLAEYLAQGGNLFVSGQNIGQLQDTVFPDYWWYGQLKAGFLGKIAPTASLSGVESSVFADLELLLNGPGSADNQMATDQVQTLTAALTQPSIIYADGRPAALEAGLCEPFRIVYLGFGLEGVSAQITRSELVNRSLAFFAEPENPVGLQVAPRELRELVIPGSEHTIDMTMRNLSETLTDTFHLKSVNAGWPVSLSTETLELGPCQTGHFSFTVSIPESLPGDSTDSFTLSAKSTNSPEIGQDISIELKTPGKLLLVDDDRWFDQEAVYRSAMVDAGIGYDFWDTSIGSSLGSSPPFNLLSNYDFVVWYTGYDWFRPVTDQESEVLYDYITQGGRLFLTSQDYMYYHENAALTRDFLGIQQYNESVTPTAVFAGDGPVLPSRFSGPLALNYSEFYNNSDGLIPAMPAVASLWHNQGMAAGTANTGDEWRTVFWALPFETLPPLKHGRIMNAVIGWLSDLGDSTFEVDQATSVSWPDVAPYRSYTLSVQNLEGAPANQVVVTNTLAEELRLDPASVAGAVYDINRRILSWQGELNSGEEHIISYRAAPFPGLPNGYRIDNQASLYYARHDLRFEKTATLWINSPDLAYSSIQVAPEIVQPGEPVTYIVTLTNVGITSAEISATVRMPDELKPLTATLIVENEQAVVGSKTVKWNGSLDVGKTAFITVTTIAPSVISPRWLPSTLILQDQHGNITLRDTKFMIVPRRYFLPIAARP